MKEIELNATGYRRAKDGKPHELPFAHQCGDCDRRQSTGYCVIQQSNVLSTSTCSEFKAKETTNMTKRNTKKAVEQAGAQETTVETVSSSIASLVIAAMRKLQLRGCETLYVGMNTYRVNAERAYGPTNFYFSTDALLQLTETMDSDAFRELLESGKRTTKYDKYFVGDKIMRTTKTTKTAATTEKQTREQRNATKATANAAKKSAAAESRSSQEAEVVKLVASRPADSPMQHRELKGLGRVARKISRQGKIKRVMTLLGDKEVIAYVPVEAAKPVKPAVAKKTSKTTDKPAKTTQKSTSKKADTVSA